MKTDTLKILPGSVPGKIRIVGPKSEADYWLPLIREDRRKIHTVVQQADELIDLVLRVANAYECPPVEISLLLNLAARDPDGMRRSFEIICKNLDLNGFLRNRNQTDG